MLFRIPFTLAKKCTVQSSLVHTPKDDSWAEPKCGWVDESTEKGKAKILRRQKDIDKGYESEVISVSLARMSRAFVYTGVRTLLAVGVT